MNEEKTDVNDANDDDDDLLKNNISSFYDNMTIVNYINTNDKKKYIKSYGILCFTKIKDNDVKVMLVKRKYTYEFYSYMTSNNIKNFNKNNFIKMFNKMTIDEKTLILKFNFDLIWNKLWHYNDSFNNIMYHKFKRQYNEFIDKYKQEIINCVKYSKNIKDSECELWSIPKGRKNNADENKYLVALREFTEETGIVRNNVYINFNYQKSFILDDKYKIKYFIGILKHQKKINLDLTNISLINEINGICWFNLNEIYYSCPYLYEHVKSAFTYVKHNDLLL